MNNKEGARRAITELVSRYQSVAMNREEYRKYNEEMTKLRFINPLFNALGWDIENRNRLDEVTFEDKISRGRVDYLFKINGVQKFVLEAKSLKSNIDNPVYVKQAVDYAYNKRCRWAVLTDFETVKIYNASIKT
ncbi:MAG: type I restriction endonuclease, partial [Nitrososphaera sp.]